MRYFIELAYNGKNYHGWQKQPNAMSVQEMLEAKLSTLLRKETEVVGCGRTDTGVHAKQYMAHFEYEEALESKEFCYKLNAMLPKDIAIYKVFEVSEKLHARFDASMREYEYHICTKPTPFLNELAWVYTRDLDIALMNEAAATLLGHTDFECFSKVHTDVKTFNCAISHAGWTIREDGMLVFTIRADRFLRNMVRAIVGTLVNVGKGKTSLAQFEEILRSKNRSEAGESVPACGLYLTQIHYPYEKYNQTSMPESAIH